MNPRLNTYLSSCATLLAALNLSSLTASADVVITGGGLTLTEEGGTFGTNNMAIGKTAFAKDVIGVAIHTIANANNGSYGNSSSWIGDSEDSFIGINLGASPVALNKVAFGRDNLGTFSDRALGLYTLQYTTVANPDATTPDASWTTIGTLDYQSAGGPNFANPHLRHVFTFSEVLATGFRIKTHAWGTGVDELELYGAPPVPFTVQHYYPLGESDPGAVAGGIAATYTMDLAGTNHLNSANAPLYSCDVSEAAALAVDSSLTMQFNGSNQFLSGPLLTTATTAYCLEAWVKPSTNSSVCPIVFNGDPFSSGLGFVWYEGSWVGLAGGITYFGNAPAVPNSWVHLAVVADSGTCTFYVNGTNAGSFAGDPATPTGSFTIAGSLFSRFNGLVDHVRFSTFQPGQFSPSQMLYHTAPVFTLTPPAITSTSTNGLTPFAINLGMTANANRAEAQCYFRYGLTTAYGSYTSTNLIGGGCPATLTWSVNGLTPLNTYHYQAVIVTRSATNVTPDAVFTTLPPIPIVSPLPVTGASSNQVTFNANVLPNGVPTSVFFQYGQTTNYGSFTVTNLITSNLSNSQIVSLNLDVLPAGTFFHGRVVASNEYGTVTGADQVFHTAGANLVVTSLADDGSAATLRSQILTAISGDKITFATNGLVGLSQGELLITNNLIIEGPGSASLLISGEQQSRIFVISTGAVVSITGLTVTNGLGLPGAGYGGTNGGGIYNAGSLVVSNCVIVGNSAGPGAAGAAGTPGNGVVGGPGGIGARGGMGGGIYNAGTLDLVNCQINGNTAGLGGTGGAGGFGAYISLHPGTACGVGGPGGDGGAGGNGGGIGNSGLLRMTMCSLSGNNGGKGGTGGAGGSSDAARSAGFLGAPDGQPAGHGGGGGVGGAICNFGTMTLTNCTLAGNFAGAGGLGGNGGASLGNSFAVLIGLPLFGGAGGNGGPGGNAGGIENSAGSMTLVACTVANNAVNAGGAGGDPGFCVSYNTYGPAGIRGASPASGGGLVGGGTLSSTIVAQNHGTNASLLSDVSGAFVSLGHNLIGVTDGGTGLINGSIGNLCGTSASPLDPRLGPLTNNGGFTLTCALLPGSPARDQGDDTLLDALATDQTGRSRLAGAHVDIGAFELPGPVITGHFVTDITNSSATLIANVIPSSTGAMAWFRWGTTTNLNNVTTPVSLGASSSSVVISNVIAGLQPGTVYYYALTVTNTSMSLSGPTGTFTTSSGVRPAITDLTPVAPGQFALKFTGNAGTGYTVRATTNLSLPLASWSVIGTPTLLSNSLFQFIDTQATNEPMRFYMLEAQ